MSLLRFLHPQGVAGIAAALVLALLLVIQKGETRHWRKQGEQLQRLYRAEVAAHSATEANYRAAAQAARAADRANAARVAAAQSTINERVRNDFEARLAAARADFDRLRRKGPDSADPRGRANADLSGLAEPAGGAGAPAGEDRLPLADALVATEQALQLEALIDWVRRQRAVAVDREDSD